MKRPVQKVVVLAISVAVMLIAGCEEQNVSGTKSNIKKHQLIATENLQLQKELNLRDREIEKQKELLEECRQEQLDLEEQSRKGVEGMMDLLSKSLGEEKERLRAENEALKAQIEKLEK